MKKHLAPYAISSLLLLACPYVLPTLYRYIDDITSHTFRIIPMLIFMYAAAVLAAAWFLRFFSAKTSCNKYLRDFLLPLCILFK